MRAVDADALIVQFRREIETFLPNNPRKHMTPVDSLKCHGWEQGLMVIQDAPTIQPDNSLQKLSDEIAKFKRTMRSSNSDYFTGYMSALSMVEGMIADMMPHEPCEGVTE